MCANVPQQRLEQRPDDAAEDHSPAQPGAVCKAFIDIYQDIVLIFISICEMCSFFRSHRTLTHCVLALSQTVAECSSNTWEKKIRVHILVFDVSTVPGCLLIRCRPCVCLLTDESVLLVLKVKLTTLIARQPHDLNLLVRAMDGEVRPPHAGVTQFVRQHVC